MTVQLIHRGFSLSDIKQFTLDEFHRVYEVSTKVFYREERERAYVDHVGAQGDSKQFKRATEKHKKLADLDLGDPDKKQKRSVERLFKGRSSVSF